MREEIVCLFFIFLLFLCRLEALRPSLYGWSTLTRKEKMKIKDKQITLSSFFINKKEKKERKVICVLLFHLDTTFLCSFFLFFNEDDVLKDDNVIFDFIHFIHLDDGKERTVRPWALKKSLTTRSLLPSKMKWKMKSSEPEGDRSVSWSVFLGRAAFLSYAHSSQATKTHAHGSLLIAWLTLFLWKRKEKVEALPWFPC